MCGIVGIYQHDRAAVIDAQLLARMTASLRHRGPDGEGLQHGPGYGLGHRRLAIVDLSGGRQPMADPQGELWLSFNGEIYNHLELREELQARGHSFATHCDSEVLLVGYREWGRDLPQHLHGMFAFGVYDSRDHSLFLCRDRLGQKPLYLREDPAGLSFASEPKALRVGQPMPALRDAALGQFLALGYVPEPHSVFADLRRLPPASALLLRAGRREEWCYWDPQPQRITAGPDVRAAQEGFLDIFDAAVRERLMADVPLGAFLSGGVDSFAVIDSMARVAEGPVQACTVGFAEAEFDERPAARASAAAVGAVLHEEELQLDAMLQQDWYAGTFDEPFADSSAIPTYEVSRLARRHVTVALSGDGGDEMFAGYRRHRFDAVEHRLRRRLPAGVWGLLGALYPKFDALPRFLRFKRTLQNLACSPAEAYARSVSQALPEEVAALLRPERQAGEPLAPVIAAYAEAEGAHPLRRCTHADRRTWLPGDILTKVDRASMAVSLEVRSPLLDHRIWEFAYALPPEFLLMGGETKGFLRETLRPRLGAAAMARPKMGFSVPLAAWMRGSLGAELEAALEAGALAGVIRMEVAQAMLAEHRAGRRDHSRLLWALLCLQRFMVHWGLS